MKLFSTRYSRFEEIPLYEEVDKIIKKTKTHEKIKKLHLHQDHTAVVLITLGIFALAFLISVIYFIVLTAFFNQMWYFKLFNLISASILFYMIVDLSHFYLQKKAIDQLPVVVENIINFYQVNQNIDYAFDRTKAFFPNYKHLNEITDAYKNNREPNLPTIWHKTLFFIYKEANEKGTIENLEDDKYANSLEMLVFNLMDIKAEQELDNATLLSFQLFSFFAPYAAILLSDWFNNILLTEMGISQTVNTLQKLNIGTLLILSGNLGTVFINWMRKVVTI